MNLENICRKVIELSRETGLFVKNERLNFQTSWVEEKGRHDLVTTVDKASELRLVDGLGKILPEAGFIAEEGTGSGNLKELNWVIDPIDGTTNFVHGLPCYAISIGLAKGDELIMGVVYEVNFDECFYAWENSPAYLNQKVIRVSETSSLDQSLLATGFPYTDFSRMEEYIAAFRVFMQNTRGLRRMGSAAVDLAYVACGRFDGFFEYRLKPWDIAGGCFIIQQAGGKANTFAGGSDYLFGPDLAATNLNLHDDFMQVIRKSFL